MSNVFEIIVSGAQYVVKVQNNSKPTLESVMYQIICQHKSQIDWASLILKLPSGVFADPATF